MSDANNIGLWVPLTFATMLISLSSCTTYNDDYYSLWNNSRSASQYHGNYSHHHTNNVSSTNKKPSTRRASGPRGLSAPKSYHFSEQATPASHKSRDSGWVHSQNPSNYTIELDSGEKPAEVANTLYKAPKSARKAQIKQRKDGKTVYTGVYGSFENEEQAQRALKDLPEDVRGKAKVKRWEKVQEKAETPQPKPPEVVAPEDDAPHSFLPPDPDPPLYPSF